MMEQKGLLLVLPVPFRVKGNCVLFESQACNGLERWADNFSKVVVAAPVLPEDLAEREKMMTWRDTATLSDRDRFELVPLPWAYSLSKFLKTYRSTRTSLAALISRCRYLQFAIGGLWGDWSAIAAIEARKKNRSYAIHTDRVEHEVMLRSTQNASPKQRLKARFIAPIMAKYHQGIIRDCTLGLWHGNDCYKAYSPFCQNNYLIHDIHLKPSEGIGTEELIQKSDRVKDETTLKICYAGRMEPMKAPLDWVKAIAKARDLGVNLQATWFGDGTLFEQMKQLIAELKLENCIHLSGLISDRVQLLQYIRESHLMLFTHITPESPRCLLESLVCGTPIVGYQSEFAQDLVKDYGGGQFVDLGDWQQLGKLIERLSQDRTFLAQLIQQAGRNGTRFNDESVFRDRSELIKKYL
ncbi:MAG: glycosyltransferase [Hydrococcus sp. Prado102]|jgi:glycosyltransferase involved in cell wall biosynthesis|nr:glycosyltransferase [Hydrococcus sp. Prado102]